MRTGNWGHGKPQAVPTVSSYTVVWTARYSAHVQFIDDMWNGHFDALQRPNRAVPDRGSFLKNNKLALLYNILSVVRVFWDTLYSKF